MAEDHPDLSVDAFPGGPGFPGDGYLSGPGFTDDAYLGGVAFADDAFLGAAEMFLAADGVGVPGSAPARPSPPAAGVTETVPDAAAHGGTPVAARGGSAALDQAPAAGQRFTGDVQDWTGWQEIIDWLRMDGDDGEDVSDPPVGVGEYLAAEPD